VQARLALVEHPRDEVGEEGQRQEIETPAPADLLGILD